jgi:hypothetical protein
MPANTELYAFTEPNFGSLGASILRSLGFYVNKSTFSVHMGRPKNIVPTEALKNAAHEVSEGAIIVRHDGKLYVIDASLVTE